MSVSRHEGAGDRLDIWSRIAAPVAPAAISWRQDGKPKERDGKFFARFVCYIEANTVRERLDEVVPGEWDLTLDPLPVLTTADANGEDTSPGCAFKARLQILGVIREDVGQGKDWKQAATDAFKRAAVRFGIGHELYAYEQNWVQVTDGGKWPKPVEDPQIVYERRHGRTNGGNGGGNGHSASAAEPGAAPSPAAAPAEEERMCPTCGGRMWDNRASKRNPRAPDFKCRDRSCDGVIWPPKEPIPEAAPPAKKKGGGKQPVRIGEIAGLDDDEGPPPDESQSFTDDIPF